MQCSVRGHSLIFFFLHCLLSEERYTSTKSRPTLDGGLRSSPLFLLKKKKKRKKNYYGFI